MLAKTIYDHNQYDGTDSEPVPFQRLLESEEESSTNGWSNLSWHLFGAGVKNCGWNLYVFG